MLPLSTELTQLLDQLQATIEEHERDPSYPRLKIYNTHATYLLSWLRADDFGEAWRTFTRWKHEFHAPTVALLERIFKDHGHAPQRVNLSPKQLAAFESLLTHYQDYQEGLASTREMGLDLGRRARAGVPHYLNYHKLQKLHLIELDGSDAFLDKPLYTLVLDFHSLSSYPGEVTAIHGKKSETVEAQSREHHLALIETWLAQAEQQYESVVLMPNTLVQKYDAFLERYHHLNDPEYINL